MRLIDADKLTKDLIENKSFFPTIVKRAIEEAPTVQVIDEWISVKERLPKKHETVLVCSRGKNNSVISIDCLCSSGKWYDQDDDVTHWMPIPQPPQMKG